MKKYIALLSLAATVLASCTVEETQPVLSDGIHIMLTGNASTMTKMSVGEENNNVFPLLWTAGDVISVNSTDGAITGETATLTANSAGKTSGSFQTDNEINADTDKDIVILYPGKSLTYENGTVTGTVPEEQVQTAANSSDHVGAGCLAIAETTLKAGQKDGVQFSMEHQTAFVKVIVAKSEEYADYYLTGVTLSATGVSLSGDLSYNVGTKTLSVANGSNTVGVTLETPVSLSEEQAVYFTANPVDLTNYSVTVVAHMADANGKEAEISQTVDGGELKASYLSILNIEAKSDIAWYQPIDPRDLMGGYAYGPQNTFFIEQFESGDNSITIDVRARGDLSKVKEPKYYGFLAESSELGSESPLCYLPNNVTAYEEKPVNEVSEDCTITVSCYGQSTGTGHWTVVGIYDENYELLWSFMIWKYLSGDEPTGVNYGDFTVMDRVIGCPYGMKLAAEKKTFDQPAVAYFQWGRKDPLPWNINNLGGKYTLEAASTNGNVEYSIKHPTVMFYDTSETGNWIGTSSDSDRTASLWGGEPKWNIGNSPEENLSKTIYDPCPEGWRVPDSIIINEVWTNGEYWEIDEPNDTDRKNSKGKVSTDNPFYTGTGSGTGGGTSVIAYKLPDGTYDYWPYAGGFYCANATDWTASRPMNTTYSCMYWAANSLSIEGSGANMSYCIYYALRTSNTTWTSDTGRGKQMAFAVRCEKEK